MQLFYDIAAGAAGGIITGFGVGGGTLLILYLTMFRGTDQLSAQGINLLYFIPTALCALVSHIKNNRVVWQVVIPAALSGVILTSLSAYFATRIDTFILRRMFGALLIVAAVSELCGKKK